jgi:hypothetical protein
MACGDMYFVSDVDLKMHRLRMPYEKGLKTIFDS